MEEAIFRSKKQIAKINAIIITKKNTIVGIINFLVKEEKLIFLNNTKISNICQNSCILKVLTLKPTKSWNKVTTPIYNLLLLVIIL